MGDELSEAKGECPTWPDGLRSPPDGSSEGLLKAPEGSKEVLLRPPRPAPLRRADSLSGVRLRARASIPCKRSAEEIKESHLRTSRGTASANRKEYHLPVRANKSNLQKCGVSEMCGDSFKGPSGGAKRDVEGGEPSLERLKLKIRIEN